MTQEESFDDEVKREMITSEDVREAKKVLATPAVRQIAREKGVLCFFFASKISVKMDINSKEKNTAILYINLMIC